jgi:hypothetical protein
MTPEKAAEIRIKNKARRRLLPNRLKEKERNRARLFFYSIVRSLSIYSYSYLYNRVAAQSPEERRNLLAIAAARKRARYPPIYASICA